MALTRHQRKKLLGHGGLSRAARRAKRSLSQMSLVNSGARRDAKAERAIATVICHRHPDIKREDVFPPLPSTEELLDKANDEAIDEAQGDVAVAQSA